MTYKLRDWLFSRQRYWGEPFPIVYDDDGLPLALPAASSRSSCPTIDDFAPTAYDPDDADPSPAAAARPGHRLVEVELDLGDGPKVYRRELNTMPQWAGSCWYELRYLDPTNEDALRRPRGRAVLDGPPVAATPAASTSTSAASSTPCCTCSTPASGTRSCSTSATSASSEPFRRLFNQGYVQAYAYTDDRGFYVPAAEVEERDGSFFHGDGRRSTASSGRWARA